MTKEETRLHILTVASSLFARNGFERTSMNDIVRETGLSKGGIYWHFKSKDEIISAIFDFFFEGQLAWLLTIEQKQASATERIRGLVEHIAGEIPDMDENFPQPLEFYAQATRDPNLMRRFKEYIATYESHLTNVIQQGIDQGEFKAIDATLGAHILVSSLEGLILIGTFSRLRELGWNERLNTTVDLLLNGLLQKS